MRSWYSADGITIKSITILVLFGCKFFNRKTLPHFFLYRFQSFYAKKNKQPNEKEYHIWLNLLRGKFSFWKWIIQKSVRLNFLTPNMRQMAPNFFQPNINHIFFRSVSVTPRWNIINFRASNYRILSICSMYFSFTANLRRIFPLNLNKKKK